MVDAIDSLPAKFTTDDAEANISASRLGADARIRSKKLPSDLLVHLASLCKPLAASYRYCRPAEMLYASVADGLRCLIVRPLEQQIAPSRGGEKSVALLSLRL